MKKLLLNVVALIFIGSSAFAQLNFGGGITFGAKSSFDNDLSEEWGVGANVRGLYQFTESVGVSAGFTYFFPNEPTFMGVKIDVTMWQANADVHYSFLVSEPFRVYGLAGLTLSHLKAEASVLETSFAEDATEVGLDVGAGIKFDFGGFAEMKYDTKFEQIAITIGFLF